MSNLWLNIRFGRWHLQGARDWPWITFRFNAHWDYREHGEPWFAILQLFGVRP